MERGLVYLQSLPVRMELVLSLGTWPSPAASPPLARGAKTCPLPHGLAGIHKGLCSQHPVNASTPGTAVLLAKKFPFLYIPMETPIVVSPCACVRHCFTGVASMIHFNLQATLECGGYWLESSERFGNLPEIAQFVCKWWSLNASVCSCSIPKATLLLSSSTPLP